MLTSGSLLGSCLDFLYRPRPLQPRGSAAHSGLAIKINQDHLSQTDTPTGRSDSGDSSSKTPLKWLDQVDNDTSKGLDPPRQVTRTLS